jgi:hypothetical protein
MLYMLALTFIVMIIHETAHILAAMTLGVRFVELQLGFMGINPSVTLPEWFTGTRQTVVHYAGGLIAGITLLLFYLGYWMRKYRRNPNFFYWSMALVTFMVASVQFAFGYLEGRYHGAYIIGAMSFLSPTDVLTYGWAVSAVFFHSALCPWRRMKTTVKSIARTPE